METSLTWLHRLVQSPTETEWRRLLDVYTPLLNSWTARAGVAEADRSDLVQEVLMVVVRRISEFKHQHSGAFRGWLRSILANHLKEYFRERVTFASDIDLDDIADPHSALSRLFDREHDEHLARWAMRLAERDFASTAWTAFRRQIFEGRKPGEVALELKLSVNAVLKAKSRILKRLRQELDCRSELLNSR